MKRKVFHRLVLSLALVVLVGSGCAKKPVPQAETAAPVQEAPVVSQMPSEQVTGITDQGIAESATGDQAPREDLAVPGLQRIFFDFDQYTLTPQARETLAGNAAYLKANPAVKIRVEGHCDERGSDEYNLALGERRARAAQDYLITLGVAPERLAIISYGEELPLDPASGEAAWAKNRRAEFKVIQ